MSEKPAGYYDRDRADLVSTLPRPLGRVLDVGCGEGAAAAGLRTAGAAWISGIELQESAAGRAAEVLDEVVLGRAEELLDRVQGPFDTILLYDVLEHLPHPETLLRGLQAIASPGARVHISVPNARHWTLVRDLVVRGTFGYAEAGHRDETHLRWLTPADAAALLERTGWDVERQGPVGGLRPVSRALGRLTGGRSVEFLAYQWQLLARARRSTPAASP
jgi:2-polyprenyl-3-methyl-5-hydroxy-6-metoxy-1,4-benzoquinol methylase